MDDDNKRHLSSWHKCPECGIAVWALKKKKCERCQDRDYYHRKQAKKGLKSRRHK